MNPPGDAAPAPDLPTTRHRPHEDVQALLTGTLFVALGVVMFRHGGLLTGGTAGLAFLLHYATGWNFSLVFFLINLPFYGRALKRMGKVFTLKTFAAVGLLAAFAQWVPLWVHFDQLSTGFAAVAGGLLMGAGMCITSSALQVAALCRLNSGSTMSLDGVGRYCCITLCAASRALLSGVIKVMRSRRLL